MRFACPDDREPLEDLDRPCPRCGRAFEVHRLPAYVGRDVFDVRDLRPAGAPPIDPDELQRLHAVIDARAVVERERFAQAGFGGLPQDLSSLRRPLPSPPPYGLAVRSALRLTRSALGAVVHRRRERERRRISAMDGYAVSTEMASDLARQALPFRVGGSLVLASKLAHSLRNMEALADVVRRWGAGSLLETGVGTGANLLLLRGLLGAGVGLSGLEPAAARVLAARATDQVFGLGVEHLLLADTLGIPVQDGTVDVVFSNYVLSYVRGSEPRALDELLRVARLGVVFFETASYRAGPFERVYLSRTQQSRRLVQITRARGDVEVERLARRRGDRHAGVPTVMAILRKR